MTRPSLPHSAAGVSEIAALVRSTEPFFGTTRVVLIDGPAGSGKTTLAAGLERELSGTGSVQVLHADDMYEGWSGLPSLGEILIDEVLAPMARGAAGGFRRWDWYRRERTDRIDVVAPAVLVVEGVGVGMRRARAFAGLVVWVEAAPAERLRRGLARDGESLREEWRRWQLVEQEEFAREGTRGAADVYVNGDYADES